MFKVLLVDDEMLVRANIKMLLDWENQGFLICAEASNGEEALRMVEKYRPDIIITDIKMPGMDGYQLSEIICEKQRNIKMIILSNYDDFEYVRGTLKNGAVDYILKHNLSKEVLLDSLNRAKRNLAETSKNNGSEFRTLNNIMALREKFVLQLLTGFYRNEEEIRKQFELLDINLGYHNILPVAMEMDHYKVVGVSNSSILKDKTLLEYSIINITYELLSEHKNGIVVHISDKLFLILLSFSDMRSEALIQSSTDSLLNTISSCLRKFLEISVSFSVGNLCSSFCDLPESYEYAVKCLKNKFYIGNNCVVKKAINESKTARLTGLSLDTEKQLYFFLKAGDSGKLTAVLEELFINIKTEAFSISSAHMVLYDLLGIVIKTCKENNIELSSVFPGGLTPQEMLSSIQTIDESRTWILSLFSKLIALISEEAVQYSSEYVKKAITFIKKNYAKNISLSDAAEVIGIGSTYLSMLFKSETGTGFTEYLGNLRIEKAKAFLESGEYEIKYIVDLCGFGSYDYFIKLFRKKVGVTPNKYLKEHGDHPLNFPGVHL
jgi:Response regulator containing CheY-like receiver domain and AraC-type DNA-binding domain